MSTNNEIDPLRPMPGWFYAIVIIVLSAVSTYIWQTYGDTVEALRVYTRTTAMISFSLFMSAFLASTLLIQWPSKVSSWLVANRRHVGLSFALAHAVHLGALLSLINAIDEPPDLITVVFGGLAYICVALMALTSNDKAAQMLGPNWHRLHSYGAYYIWLIFAYTLMGSIFQSLASLILFAVALGGLAAKIGTKRRLGTA